MEQNLNSLNRLFDAILDLIFSCFLFLPDWTSIFIGSVFGFTIIVFIYKLVK